MAQIFGGYGETAVITGLVMKPFFTSPNGWRKAGTGRETDEKPRTEMESVQNSELTPRLGFRNMIEEEKQMWCTACERVLVFPPSSVKGLRGGGTNSSAFNSKTWVNVRSFSQGKWNHLNVITFGEDDLIHACSLPLAASLGLFESW